MKIGDLSAVTSNLAKLHISEPLVNQDGKQMAAIKLTKHGEMIDPITSDDDGSIEWDGFFLSIIDRTLNRDTLVTMTDISTLIDASEATTIATNQANQVLGAGGNATVTTNSTGYFSVTHSLGYGPQIVTCIASGNTPYIINSFSTSSSFVQFRVFSAGGSPCNSCTLDVFWSAR